MTGNHVINVTEITGIMPQFVRRSRFVAGRQLSSWLAMTSAP